jgi:hypothetical protein
MSSSALAIFSTNFSPLAALSKKFWSRSLGSAAADDSRPNNSTAILIASPSLIRGALCTAAINVFLLPPSVLHD